MRSTSFPGCVSSLHAPRRALSRRGLAAALLIALAPLAANAATIVVTSRDDTNPTASGTCTLRQAIVSMNAGALAGNCAVSDGEAFGVHDAITFAASALTTATTPGTITLADSADTSGTIGGTLLITADDAARLRQRGDRRDRAAGLHASDRPARRRAAARQRLRHRRGGNRAGSDIRQRFRLSTRTPVDPIPAAI